MHSTGAEVGLTFTTPLVLAGIDVGIKLDSAHTLVPCTNRALEVASLTADLLALVSVLALP